MSGLRKLQCDNCGGVIDGVTLTCQSCGMQYMLNEDMTLGRVITSNLQWSTIGCMVSVPSYVLFDISKERAAEVTLKEMAESLAAKLLPFMEFQSAFDPVTNSMVTCSRIRVAEPIVTRQGYTAFQMPHITAEDVMRWNEV